MYIYHKPTKIHYIYSVLEYVKSTRTRTFCNYEILKNVFFLIGGGGSLFPFIYMCIYKQAIKKNYIYPAPHMI